MDDISLERFTELNKSPDVGAYIEALQAFDGIEQMQDLKRIARYRGGVRPGASVLDVGCGFGLETLRLADVVGSGGAVAGVDLSAAFIEEARTRADTAQRAVEYRVGSADALPWADAYFDCVRAERLLIYLEDFGKAVREMVRVAKPGRGIAFIEPDFSTTTLNLPDRALARRGLAHEIDTAVAQSWLPGPLLACLEDLRLRDIYVDSRVAIFPQELCATYFAGVGEHAAQAGVLSAGEARRWSEGVAELAAVGRLFGTVGYFVLAARV